MSFYRNNPPLLPDWVHLCKHLHPQWNKTERTWKFEAHNFLFVFSFHIISCFSCCISLFHAHFHIGFIFFCIAFNPFLWFFISCYAVIFESILHLFSVFNCLIVTCVSCFTSPVFSLSVLLLCYCSISYNIYLSFLPSCHIMTFSLCNCLFPVKRLTFSYVLLTSIL